MRANNALHKMREGKPALGAGLAFSSPLIAEVLSQVGFDFLLVREQHFPCC